MFHIIEIKSNNIQDPETGKWSLTSAVVTPIPQYADRDKAISQWHGCEATFQHGHENNA